MAVSHVAPNEPRVVPPNHRPARVLIGWLPREQALLTLAGRQLGVIDPALGERVDRGHASVRSRPPALVDSDLALVNVGEDVAARVREQLQHPAMSAFVAEGWQPRIVDLRRVASVQPVVFTDGWNAQIAADANASMLDLATITIPAPGEGSPIRVTQSGSSFCIQSPNPNLRIASPATDPNAGVFGFMVQLSPSVMQVVKVGNRLLLRDGYNRAYALLRRGIHTVPCLYREWPSQQDLGIPSGMLSPSVYLGDRPALLPDFLDDDVAADVSTPAARKMILIHAVETLVE